jgi:serine/threonine protein kinase
VGVDTRSDLYSLGVVMWEMLTGKIPFRGTPAEVMYQHQHAPLPLEQLLYVPQPIVVLLQVLLEKDPKWRFQNPTELVQALPRVNEAIKARRSITHQSLREIPDQQLASGKAEFLTNLTKFFCSPKTSPNPMGRTGDRRRSDTRVEFFPWTQELRAASVSELVTRNNPPRKEYRCSPVRESERK